MKTMKRILALIGVIGLLGLYITTLVAALLNTPVAHNLFLACIYGTIVFPIMLYGYLLIYKVIKNRTNNKSKEEDISKHS